MNEQEQPKEFIIKAELIQDILNYLAEQKFKDTVNLINGIQSGLVPYEAPEKPLEKVK